MTHSPRIDTNSKESVLFRFLCERAGAWVDAWDLSRAVLSTALSTHLSHVRERARPLGWRLECGHFIRDGGRVGRRYRLVKLGADRVEPRRCEVCGEELAPSTEAEHLQRLARCSACRDRLHAEAAQQ